MKSILAIYRREMGSYFVSPIAYAVVGIFLLICGFFFQYYLSAFIQQAFMMQMQAGRMGGGPQAFDVPSAIIRQFFPLASMIILFLTPMLTMSVYAEERKRGTMELLMTSPITEFQIVMGKFLAAFSLFAAMLLPTFFYQVEMGIYSDPGLPWKVVLSGYLGLLLLGAVLVAIGTFISSLTESQIIAAVITFLVFILLWVLPEIVIHATSATAGDIVQYLSITRHLDDFSRGVIDTSSIIFYISLVGLSVFLTFRSLDSMRWRRA